MATYNTVRECYLKPGEVCNGHLYSDGLDFTTEGTFFFLVVYSLTSFRCVTIVKRTVFEGVQFTASNTCHDYNS